MTYLFRILLLILLALPYSGKASAILVPMDETQKNHLKAYGVAYWVLENEVVMEWLLNYRGGSFLFPHAELIEEELILKGVSYSILPDSKVKAIKSEIANPEVNMEVVQLEKAPKIAVYTPKGKQPWDDAVTMVLTYAEIPYEEIYDSTVVKGGLPEFDWLHLHHEDFTGQYGKFYRNYHTQSWYQKQVRDNEEMAKKLGFEKVSELKLAVAVNIKNFVAGGGFLFTMCSGTDSYDIALSAESTDICEHMYDGDPAEANFQSKIDFTKTLAFKDFTVEKDPMVYEYSDIDGTKDHLRVPEQQDKFFLFEFSAKWDVVPTMLCQNHTMEIDGFMGQTTDFRTEFIKPDVLIMGENKAMGTARYIHGEFGEGTWTFYGGHDPEDYQHFVGDPPTDLNLHPNSPGYRLILNNILFPAAKKKKRKT
ncbi:asparagine synthetase B [Paracrocinitomix mangrovi]|uniref:asparagine synthetase B n=1 Tax=Paracrocinitomix mangrovi TaxID=2862509 RepID=UPI001C8D3842|nr:asparagine synthetase B [Paracrocinitomix mangrovi]UKN01733.1 asparagine synthetase B [Paracrocinitomix mangrovi]